MLQSTPLWYLMQVGNYQSLSIAAEQLHISQPSLSIAIKKLENELGLQLLERTYRGVRLTPDGEKVVELATKAFSYFDEIENLSTTHKLQTTTEPLKDIIIYTNPALIQILTSAFHDSQNQIANLHVHIKTIDATVNVAQLLMKEPNTVVLATMNEQATMPSSIGISILSKSKSYVMCSSKFSYIPKEQTSISFKELLKIPLVVIEQGFEFQDTLLRILNLHGTPNIAATVNDIYSLTALIGNGSCASFGSTLMPFDINDYNTRYVSIRTAPKFVTGLVYNKSISPEIISALHKQIQHGLS